MNENSDSGLIEAISPNDEMFQDNLQHYFSVGRSALENILAAMQLAGCQTVNSILDLPSGHGRVLRHVRARFPYAQITACDLNHDGVDFCAHTFGANPMYSASDFRQVDLASQFDLIWCGSLFTHFNRARCSDLLAFLSKHLLPRGLLLFTTHGRFSAHMLRSGKSPYGLSDSDAAILLAYYRNSGFGYVNYPHSSEYGISLASPAWTLREIQRLATLKVILYREAGWDNHQDVIACECLSRCYAPEVSPPT